MNKIQKVIMVGEYIVILREHSVRKYGRSTVRFNAIFDVMYKNNRHIDFMSAYRF